MRYFNLLLSALFLASAAVQLNDPDPIFWVALYGGVAIVCAFAAFNRYHVWLIILGLAVSAFELFRLAPGFMSWISSGAPSIISTMQAETPYIEIVREFLGVLVCFVVLLFHYIRGRKFQKAAIAKEDLSRRL